MRIANHIYRGGEGLPLILLNAYPVDHRMWDECAVAVARIADAEGIPAFPIWAPDMPGSGESGVPTAEESGPQESNGSYPQALNRAGEAYVRLMREGGYEKAIWVGLSMGGYMVMNLCRIHPEAVAGLALCDTMAASDGVGGEGRLATADACERSDSLEPVMHFAQPQPGDSTVKRSPAFVEKMTAWIQDQTPAGAAWRQRMTYGRADLSDVPASIDVPVAVVSGTLDPTSDPSVMRPLAERIGGNAVFTQIEDCGHFSAVEHPETVARALVDLVKRVQGL
ncbi:alpha/beta hydrolase [Bifidobacterium lemurum]|uniref:Alpha/beta hydrolase n=1 Tax=Bifidobacterium lemurum TaxID=1603886 RepID=A0A261FR65_9BIFI|nr:alpha/beta hydrolase [Bifidobacterium lemurum]OZG61296.1 alpha/beta hydrolase [Bifidobacterium lemurum]QOL34684.1 alpha/beta hydrolase [Bifidobacterium lemurum]